MEWLLNGVRKGWSALKIYFLHYDLESTSRSECAGVFLREVNHPSNYFFLNGKIPIKSLIELSAVMNEMDKGSFAFHMGKDRNDFSEWVGGVIGDRTLAEKLNQLKTREEMAKAVEVRANYFKRKMEEKH